MKELSIKEKAKRYDESLERARIWQNNLYDTNDKDYADELNYIFPELCEPEDEKIRKALINVFATHKDYEIFFGVSVKDILAWLEKQKAIDVLDAEEREFADNVDSYRKEVDAAYQKGYNEGVNATLEKQGEQNPNVAISTQLDDQMSADNNESKFNIGDEIKTTNEEPLTITKIDDKGYWSGDLFVCSFEDSTKWELVGKFKPKFLNGQWIVWHGKCYTVYDNSCGYELLDQDGFITSLEYGTVEVNAHLWTIDDAKDGDVLADNIGVILFKSIRDNNVINYYAYLSGLFAVQKGEEYWGYAVNCALSPATKEQRERFFAAMHNAGYEWDAEKLELYKKPKFKVGEWITDGQLTCKVLSVTGKSYELHLYNDDYCHFETDVQSVDKHYHLWTIQDTHDGDVLTSIGFHSNCTFILKGLDNWKFDEPNGDRAVATGYCCLSVSSDKMEFGIQGPDCVEVNTVKPASKIQRELLFKKMKEAGYEWDAKKKELKKIERKPIVKDESVINILNKENQQVQQEDLIMKPSLKTKQNWSEEDKKRIQRISDFIWKNRKGDTDDIYQQEQDVKWLKSLRPQKQWKPSDEQMEVLEALVEDNNQRYFYTTLNSLYEQLKKLKE